MNRSLRKFLAFSLASAVFATLPAVGAGAEYIAEQLSQNDFGAYIQTKDSNIYIENGTAEQIENGSQVVVIGNDGSKQTITLDEAITGLYCYEPVTPPSYIWNGVSSCEFSFNYYDPTYRITTESDVLIAAAADGHVLMDTNGKKISKTFDNIYFINNGYYLIENLSQSGSDSGNSLGIMTSAGKIILAPSADIRSIHMTADGKNFLINKYTQDGGYSSYFADLSGRKVSDEYYLIKGISYTSYGRSFSADKLYNGYNDSPVLCSDVYAFYSSSDSVALGFGSFSPSTESGRDVYLNASYYTNMSKVFDDHFTLSLSVFDYTDDNGENHYKSVYYSDDGTLTENSASNYSECSMIDESAEGTDIMRTQPFNTVETFKGKKVTFFTSYSNGKSILYDSNKNIIDSGKDINIYPTFLLVRKENSCAVYNAKLELVDTFDKFASNYSLGCFYGVKGSSVDLYDARFNIIKKNTSIPVSDSYSSVYSLRAGGKAGCAVKNTSDFTFTIYDSSFEKTGEIKPPYSGEVRSFSLERTSNGKIYSHYSISGVYIETDPQTYAYNNKFELFPADGYYSCEACGDYFKYRKTASDPLVLCDKSGKTVYTAPAEIKNIEAYTCKDGDNGYFTRYVGIKDGSCAFFDSSFNVIREIETSVQLPGDQNLSSNFELTAESMHNVIFNDNKSPSSGSASSIIYDMVTDEIKYTQTGKYDLISGVTDNYAIAVNTDSEGNIINQGIILLNGIDTKTLIPAEDDIKARLAYYSFNNSSGFSYSNISTDIALTDIASKQAASDAREVFAVINTSPLASSNYLNQVEKDLYVRLEDIDTDFAETYGFGIAIKTANGSYSVYKDGKWAVADTSGNLICEPKYDVIYNFNGGLAQTITYRNVNTTGDEYDINTETYVTKEITIPKAYYGIINKDGKEIIEPYCNEYSLSSYDTDGALMSADKDTIYTKKFIGTKAQYNSYGGRRAYYEYEDISTSSADNGITNKYGYDTAEECGDGFYIVRKDGLKGIVTADNEVVVPVEYKDILSFTYNDFTNKYMRPELMDELSGERYTSPMQKLSDGSYLVNVRTSDNKIRPYKITYAEPVTTTAASTTTTTTTTSTTTTTTTTTAAPTTTTTAAATTASAPVTTTTAAPPSEPKEYPLGDPTGDGLIDATDASFVLAEYAKLSTGGASALSDGEKSAADVNGDGNVDASDASFILAYYAHLSTGGKLTFSDFLGLPKDEEPVYPMTKGYSGPQQQLLDKTMNYSSHTSADIDGDGSDELIVCYILDDIGYCSYDIYKDGVLTASKTEDSFVFASDSFGIMKDNTTGELFFARLITSSHGFSITKCYPDDTELLSFYTEPNMVAKDPDGETARREKTYAQANETYSAVWSDSLKERWEYIK